MSPAPTSHDREWLEYDRASAEMSQADAAHAGAAHATDGSAPGPWLRHDLPGDAVAADPGPEAGGDEGSEPMGGLGGAPGGSARDPAWLAPELEVPDRPTPSDRPHDPADGRRHEQTHDQTRDRTHDRTHDTGVPPTLAEEPPTVETSQSAGGAAYDEPVAVEHETERESEPAIEHGHASVGDDESAEQTSPRADAGPDADDADDEEDAGLLGVAGAAVKEFAIVVGMALVLSFIVKTWLLQAFYIPSGSMEETLVLNDRVIVSKLTPGPVDLKRGDIIVFADPGEWLEETPQVPHGKVVTAVRETMTFVGLLPDNSENHLIKRVIGLPGDRVVCCDEGGRITVNGTAIKEPYLKPGDSASDQDFDITVPRGRVWVMGDHRSNSADSRAHDAPENDGSQGSVDERLIVGRAVALVWPLDHLTWLSNPTTTFAKVPAATSEGEVPSTEVPQGEPGTDSGGVEVTGDGDGEGGG